MSFNRNKRKPYFSSNLMAKKKKDYLFLQTGNKGFICTCNGNEKQCIRESYNVLNEYADQLYGEENVNKPSNQVDTSSIADEDDEMDEFQKEVDALKSQNKETKNRFKAVDTGIANCIFIKTNLDDPVGLTNAIMKDLADKKQLKARFLLRMVPIENTCKAYVDDIVNAAGPLFDRYFKTDPVTYAIVFSKRCNSNLERGVVIDKLAAMVQERNNDHKVNLSNPAVTIIVEAMKKICGLAVIRDYVQMCKYNLRQLCGLPLNDRGDASAADFSSKVVTEHSHEIDAKDDVCTNDDPILESKNDEIESNSEKE